MTTVKTRPEAQSALPTTPLGSAARAVAADDAATVAAPSVNADRKRHRLRNSAIVAAVLLLPVGWSYGGYLTAPGNDPFAVRTVNWLRDHGFESRVNDVEQWWYTRARPKGATPKQADLPTGISAAPELSGPASERVVSPQRAPMPGEGIWRNVSGLAAPASGVQQTFLRPDTRYPSVAVDVVRLDQRAVSLVYVPGTQEVGGQTFAWQAQIPAAKRAHVLAAFTAGFKFRHIKGGAYTEGKYLGRTLRDGSASIVIRRDGSVDIAKWGRDATLTADIVSVRQNLALIVDNGAAALGLSADRGGQWGTRKSQFQFTWRTGIGIDTQGRLIYAAGHKMTLTELAQTMVAAGAVRAMQLDIHPTVSFNWFRPNPGSSLGVVGTKLMPSMPRDANRFLSTEERDFLAVMAR